MPCVCFTTRFVNLVVLALDRTMAKFDNAVVKPSCHKVGRHPILRMWNEVPCQATYVVSMLHGTMTWRRSADLFYRFRSTRRPDWVSLFRNAIVMNRCVR